MESWEIHEWEHERAKSFERANSNYMLGQDDTGMDGKLNILLIFKNKQIM